MTQPRDDWPPQGEPDPQRILQEARSYARNGRHAEALKRHLWFHDHALKYQPSLYGVRLSFALSDWRRLGSRYPPALEELKKVRDEAADRVRGGEGDRKVFHDAFHDFVAINRVLDDEDRTVELFAWLDAHFPNRAREVIDIAQPVLMKAKEYGLCGRHVDPDASLKRLRFRLRTTMAQDRSRSFALDVASLVASLVINDRKAEADRVAAKALLDVDTSYFRDRLDRAKRGEAPEPDSP
jgi:hypothetical protein